MRKCATWGGLICSLQTSLKRRFSGIFVNVKMADGESDGPLLPFSDPLYLKASFGTMWLTHDVLVPENTKEAVSAMIKGNCYIILHQHVRTRL